MTPHHTSPHTTPHHPSPTCGPSPLLPRDTELRPHQCWRITCFASFYSYASHPHAGQTTDGLYNILTADGALIQLTCDMSNGGWTLIFDNDLKSNHNDFDFTDQCPCSSDKNMNDQATAHNSNGWTIGVSACPGSNTGTESSLSAPNSFSTRARLGSTIPNIGRFAAHLPLCAIVADAHVDPHTHMAVTRARPCRCCV